MRYVFESEKTDEVSKGSFRFQNSVYFNTSVKKPEEHRVTLSRLHTAF
jgi:hypothetical protein